MWEIHTSRIVLRNCSHPDGRPSYNWIVENGNKVWGNARPDRNKRGEPSIAFWRIAVKVTPSIDDSGKINVLSRIYSFPFVILFTEAGTGKNPCWSIVQLALWNVLFGVITTLVRLFIALLPCHTTTKIMFSIDGLDIVSPGWGSKILYSICSSSLCPITGYHFMFGS